MKLKQPAQCVEGQCAAPKCARDSEMVVAEAAARKRFGRDRVELCDKHYERFCCAE